MHKQIKPPLITRLCFVYLLLGLLPAAAQPTDGKAIIVRVNGTARYSAPNGSWQPLKAGQGLPPGSTIETDKQTTVDLALVEPGETTSPVTPTTQPPNHPVSPPPRSTRLPSTPQNTLRLWENTQLKLKELTYTTLGIEAVSETQLDLVSGRITGKARKLTPGSIYEIKLPNALAGIKGTTYDISARGVLKVLEGTVVVAYIDLLSKRVVTQNISTGQVFDIRSALMAYLTSGERRELESAIEAFRAQGSGPWLHYYPDRNLDRISPGKGLGRGRNR